MRRWLPDRLPEIPEIPEIRETTAPKVVSGISGISDRPFAVVISDGLGHRGLEKTSTNDLVGPAASKNGRPSAEAETVALLRSGTDDWSAEDWQVFFDERAGIAEFDGGLPRDQAEARAFVCCVAEWLYRNPVFSEPERCLGCNGSDRSHDPLLPVGIAGAGEAWLHSGCSSAWSARRRAEAADALVAVGIPPPRLLTP